MKPDPDAQGKLRLGPSCVVGFESGYGATSKASGRRRSSPISRWLLCTIGSMPGQLAGCLLGFSVKGTRTSHRPHASGLPSILRPLPAVPEGQQVASTACLTRTKKATPCSFPGYRYGLDQTWTT